MRLRGFGNRLRAGGGGSTDSDAAAWAAAVTANGGTYSASTLSAVSTFVKAAKASGYWDKLNRINLFCGDQLVAALVPLKAGGGSATDTNVNFVSGDYSEATGLTGNGSTKYLKTGLIPSASLTRDDTHLSVYSRGSSGKSGIGVADGVNHYMFGAYSDFKDYAQIYGGVISGVLGTPYGFNVGSRTASNRIDVYRNGVSQANSTAAATGALATHEIYVFALNNGAGGLVDAGAGPLAAYSIGSGLTAADVTAYNTHMEAFQDALGRGVQ